MTTPEKRECVRAFTRVYVVFYGLLYLWLLVLSHPPFHEKKQLFTNCVLEFMRTKGLKSAQLLIIRFKTAISYLTTHSISTLMKGPTLSLKLSILFLQLIVSFYYLIGNCIESVMRGLTLSSELAIIFLKCMLPFLCFTKHGVGLLFQLISDLASNISTLVVSNIRLSGFFVKDVVAWGLSFLIEACRIYYRAVVTFFLSRLSMILEDMFVCSVFEEDTNPVSVVLDTAAEHSYGVYLVIKKQSTCSHF